MSSSLYDPVVYDHAHTAQSWAATSNGIYSDNNWSSNHAEWPSVYDGNRAPPTSGFSNTPAFDPFGHLDPDHSSSSSIAEDQAGIDRAPLAVPQVC